MSLDLNKQCLKQIEEAEHILISTSSLDKGDGLAAAVSLKLFLKKINKPADIVVAENIKNKLNFLNQTNKIKSGFGSLKKTIINIPLQNNNLGEFNYDIKDDHLKIYLSPKKGEFNHSQISISPSDFKYDLIIILSSPDLDSLGDIYYNHTQLFYHVPIINIDNSSANENYGQINYININFASTSEIIYKLIEYYNTSFIDPPIATALLTGLIIKTNTFRNSNINPQTLKHAADLIKQGAERQSIINNLNSHKNLPTLNLWGRALARLKQDTHYKLAWSMISQTDFNKSGAQAHQLSGIVDELINNSPQIEIIVLLYESPQGNIVGELHTSQNHNALELTLPFEGQGSQNTASFILKTNRLIEAENQVINKIRQRLHRV